MSLDFRNLAPTSVPPTHLRASEGRIINIMQPLLTGMQDGVQVDVPRELVTFKGLFKERINYPDKHDRQLLRDNYFFVPVAAIGDPDGSGEIVLGLYEELRVRELVNGLNPKSPLSRGVLPVSGAVYNEIKRNGGYVISADLGAALRSKSLAEPKKRRAMFEYMAGGKPELVDGNLDLINGTIEDSMAFYPANVPGMRLVAVSRLGRSFAGSSLGLGYGGRLLGLAPEAQQDDARSAAPRAVVPVTLNVGGLVDALYQGLNGRPLAQGVTKKFLREQLEAYQRTLE